MNDVSTSLLKDRSTRVPLSFWLTMIVMTIVSLLDFPDGVCAL